MKKEYDFSKMKSMRNPYAKKLRKQITIQIDQNNIDYFKNMADRTGIAYQKLINLYLSDCAEKRKEIDISWN